MRFWVLTFMAAWTFGALGVTAATAAENDPALALHVTSQTSKNMCTISLPSSCEGYVTASGSSGFYTIYMTVANYDSFGVAGAQFGLDYEDQSGMGCDISSWRTCGDLEFQDDNWPASGSGNVITWDYGDNCQGDFVDYTPVLVGAFEVSTYSGDMFSLAPRPVDGRVKIATCTLVETDLTDISPSRVGAVSFGNQGYNPCLEPQTPVHPTTWGNIKSLYEN